MFATVAIVAGVWLGWEVVRATIAARAPPELAIRLSPFSPEVLSVAAEGELRSGRLDNARALSQESLARAPFNVRALRVWGLTEAVMGKTTTAVEALTLSGNWSLRDDPSHAWLFEHHLRQGNFGLAFAHLDTLTRRRADLQPRLFDLLEKAGTSDSRGLQALLRLLSVSPPWRQLFFEYLQDTAKADGLSATLAVALAMTPGRFTHDELGRLYGVLADRRQYALLRQVSSKNSSSNATELVRNSDFDAQFEDLAPPFSWANEPGAGSSIQIVPDDVREGNSALRVEYDGFNAERITRQLLLLLPGDYALTGEALIETSAGDPRLRWTVMCSDTNAQLATYDVPSVPNLNNWRKFGVSFSVPRGSCEAQWLALEPIPGDRLNQSVAWFDKMVVSAVGARASR